MNDSIAPGSEHVIGWNMTTYEWIYVVLVLVQTIFLIKYAGETIKLRKTADAQLEVVKTQNETMRLQNETLAKQLAATLAEAEYSRQLEVRRISPLFEIRTTATAAGKRHIQIEDAKARIQWNEIRTNVAWKGSNVGTHGPSVRSIEIQQELQTVYIGIRYTRLVDNEEVTVVFSFNTTLGQQKEEKGMDFYALPVPH